MLCFVLHKLGHEVTLITSAPDSGLTEGLIAGIKTVYIGQSQSAVADKRWLQQAQQAFLKLQQKETFACVFSEGHSGFLVNRTKQAQHLAKFYFIHNPSLMHFHNNWQDINTLRTFISYFLYTIPEILYRIFSWELPLAHSCTKIISVSKFNARKISQFYCIRTDKIEVINNWVDMQMFSPDLDKRGTGRKQWNISDNAFVFLLVGAIWRRKGFHLAISSFSKIASLVPNSILIICGQGSEKQNLIKMVKENKLETRIRFLGEVSHPDLPLVYNLSDIFLMPSLMLEGHAYTLIEAMACGLPVIASAKGGNIETVEDSGILFPSGNKKALSQAMLKLALDTDTRKILSEKACKRVLDFFSEKVAINKIEKLLHSFSG
jgi:glycosyltransferase involved in cell wall biosynthesis